MSGKLAHWFMLSVHCDNLMRVKISILWWGLVGTAITHNST